MNKAAAVGSIALVCILFFGLFLYLRGTGRERTLGKEVVLRVGDATVAVEVAETPFEQMQGLSGRASLGAGHGMLFAFPHKAAHRFWMKDMQFPLDIIWINDLEIVSITENVPPEGMVPTNLYAPPEPVDMVLEINAGEAARLGILPGMLISIE